MSVSRNQGYAHTTLILHLFPYEGNPQNANRQLYHISHLNIVTSVVSLIKLQSLNPKNVIIYF
jgi:hypothetical protein